MPVTNCVAVCSNICDIPGTASNRVVSGSKNTLSLELSVLFPIVLPFFVASYQLNVYIVIFHTDLWLLECSTLQWGQCPSWVVPLIALFHSFYVGSTLNEQNVLAVTCSWSAWNWEFWLHLMSILIMWQKCVYCYDGCNAGSGISLIEQQHWILVYSN